MATVYNNVIPNATSTNANPTYYRSNFIPITTITINNKPVQVLDILSPSYLKVLKNLQPVSTYKYMDGQQITSKAFKYDSTTSSWYLYIALNGYFHPYQMQPGDVVFVPNSIQAINTNSTTLSSPAASTVTF